MKTTKSMYILFGVKETVMSRYAIYVPEELKKASDDELKAWVKKIMKSKDNNAEFVRRLSTESQEVETDFEFSVAK